MNRRTTIALVAVLLVVGLVATALALAGGGDDADPDAGATPGTTPRASVAPEGAPTGPEVTPTADTTGDPTLDVPADAPAQMRGIWVHLFDRSLKTREGIDQFLDAAVAANLNTVIVQGARRHDAFYASDVLPPTTDEELAAGLDVLGELVPAAHERGLQVHVWYSLVPAMHATMMDEDLGPDHLSTQHGFGSDDPWLQAGNDPSYAYMDPAIPGYQDHVVALLRDVVQNYDVDGVHLDYIRYECLQVSDDGSCLQADPGADATPNQHPVTMQRYREHGEGSLADFMRTQTTDIVRRAYIEVAEIDPSVVVSAALIAQGDGPGADRGAFERARAYWNKGQDWASWIEEGIIDHAYPMAYFRESDPQWAQAYDRWVGFTGLMDSDEHVVAVGQGSYLNCVGESLSQVQESVDATDGVVLYSYQGDVAADGCPDDEPGGLLRALRDGMFAEPAQVPEVPRKTDPSAGHVLVRAADGQTVTVTGPDGATQSRRADATGHAGFVWLEPGTWQVAVEGGANLDVAVQAGEVARLDTR